MGVSEIGFPQNVVYKQRIQTSDTLPVTIGASKYCEFLFDIDAGDRMTPLGIVGWGCDDKTQVFLLDFYMDNNLQTAKLILKNPYATTIAINSLYIDVLYSKQGLDMSEVDIVDNLTTDSAVAALSARQGKVLNEGVYEKTTFSLNLPSGYSFEQGHSYKLGNLVFISGVIQFQSTTAKRITLSNCIPDGFRSRDRVDVPGNNNSSDDVVHVLLAGSNTGTIDFYRPSTDAMTQVAFSVVYPII